MMVYSGSSVQGLLQLILMCDAGIAVADDAFIPLSEAMEVWHFDMLSPPEESHQKPLDVTFTRYTQKLC